MGPTGGPMAHPVPVVERFAGRRILVTGAASGIGRATVLRLLAEGGAVVAADRDEPGLDATAALAADDGGARRLTTIGLDVTDESSVSAAVPTAVSRLGGLDVLVNAAGVLRSAHTHLCPLELWDEVVRTNLTGTFLVTRAALPALLESGRGVVVNFSSIAATLAHPYMAAYAASKGGILAFTRAIAAEYAGRGLRAVAVAPGGIATPMTDGVMDGLPPDADMRLLARLRPVVRRDFAPPETVSGVVAMLASEDGAYITGAEVRVDGGAGA